jgi:dipeptidyl aminopeptidase/acylaminoacyl peptidase
MVADARPFGSWPSPITAAALVSGAAGIGEVQIDGDAVWWSESRPDEGGRISVMRWHRGVTDEVTPPDAYVRTLVHEYGGGAWTVDGGELFYVDLSDQRLRRMIPGSDPTLLTPEPDIPSGLRYADGRVTPDRRWFVCVRERHGGSEPENELVAVALDGTERVEVLWQGSDFVMAPRISPLGDRLAWIAWDHPNMPWDQTALWNADLGDGVLAGPRVVVSNGTEALCEPGWGSDGELYVCSDRAEWWNLYRVVGDDLAEHAGGAFEIATPPWVFGMQRWALLDDGPIVVAGHPTGDRLIVAGTELAGTDDTITSLQACGPRSVVFAGAGFDHEAEVVRLDLPAAGPPVRTVLRPARPLGLAATFVPAPEAITFPTAAGEVAHALFYEPAHPDHVGPEGEAPPLVVLAHGGPTAAARRQLQLPIRFWTSRGFAVVDVDYRGSTGYGRSFRQALNGNWGVADVADCVAAVSYLAQRGDVDPDRVVIRGGSAGGFTVLSALCSHDVFAAGASHYGVADLEALARDTHKFESRYLESLVGPRPEADALYAARSPINNIDGFSAPMIFLQGSEDQIVPPDQSEMIVAALREKGIPVAYLLFEGEQHGFRRSESIISAIEAELAFFGRVLGFEPADELPPIEIT